MADGDPASSGPSQDSSHSPPDDGTADKEPNIASLALGDTFRFFNWLFKPDKPKQRTVRVTKQTTTKRTTTGRVHTAKASPGAPEDEQRSWVEERVERLEEWDVPVAPSQRTTSQHGHSTRDIDDPVSDFEDEVARAERNERAARQRRGLHSDEDFDYFDEDLDHYETDYGW